MGIIDRIFRDRDSVSEARRAELSGDLPRAIDLWAQANKPEEVARIMVLRGDAEIDVRRRLQHYVQAVATAPPDSLVHKQARVKKATFALALASDAHVSATTRRDLLEAAKDLEDLGETDRAAEAYALLKDTEGQARALMQGGQVERLETLLSDEQSKANLERERKRDHAEVELLVLAGRRREALDLAERLAKGSPLGAPARQRVENLRTRRVAAGVCRILLSGRPVNLIVDDEVVIGRTEGTVLVRSSALSRRHLSIVRRAEAVVVLDLGSRNGTLLRGMHISGALPVGAGVELELGGVVKVKVVPSAIFGDAVDVEVGGERYVASLGPARLGVGTWRLERASDGWVELVTTDGPPAYRDGMVMYSRTTLLVGDRVALVRGGQVAPALEILGRADWSEAIR
jgi:hypothetical protein